MRPQHRDRAIRQPETRKIAIPRQRVDRAIEHEAGTQQIVQGRRRTG
jgi:hypothetical protein